MREVRLHEGRFDRYCRILFRVCMVVAIVPFALIFLFALFAATALPRTDPQGFYSR